MVVLVPKLAWEIRSAQLAGMYRPAELKCGCTACIACLVGLGSLSQMPQLLLSNHLKEDDKPVLPSPVVRRIIRELEVHCDSKPKGCTVMTNTQEATLPLSTCPNR